MTGLVVIIICIVISVFCYKKIANSCRNKGRGSIRTFLTAFISSVFLFIITMGIGIANLSPSDDKVSESTNQGRTVANSSTNEKNKNIYICNKFDAITQTRQGTKYNSGFYSDKKTHITYAITDDKLTTKMSIPGFDDSSETATFNKIADDGSRKYGNSSSNFFISVLNDSTIKVITVNFNTNMTLTQMCSN
ncbi:hypothetical protein [Enterobacter ludwigii]|uniref:hypothetical protein n=1 Tax=Enterobacter ludwigii TaxID=299767 RepID=UPI003F717755